MEKRNIHAELKRHQYRAISDLIIVPTYRCTAECSHCFTASSTRKDGVMKLSDMREYMDEAQEAGAKSVVFFGGEPLYFDLMEMSIRWRAVLAISKAYPEMNTRDRDTALRVLKQAIESDDIFVKVRAYEALFNIGELEKRPFPDVDAALRVESDFVQQWALYNVDFR